MPSITALNRTFCYLCLLLCYIGDSFRNFPKLNNHGNLLTSLEGANRNRETNQHYLSQITRKIITEYSLYNHKQIIDAFNRLTNMELCQIYSSIPRIAFNIGIKPRLQRSSLQENSFLLANLFLSNPFQVSSDTFNTFLSDALFGKRNYSHGKHLYLHYIEEQKQLLPTIRTFNHLLEAARIEGIRDEIRWLDDKMMDEYKLFPDAATFATIIRSSTSLPYILKTYDRAEEANLTNPIIFRCMLESLGTSRNEEEKEQSPAVDADMTTTRAANVGENILLVAFQNRNKTCFHHNDGYDIFRHALTGDSLVAALITQEKLPNPFYLPEYHEAVSAGESKTKTNPTSHKVIEKKFLQSLLAKQFIDGFDIMSYLLLFGLPPSLPTSTASTASTTSSSSSSIKLTFPELVSFFRSSIQSLLRESHTINNTSSWNRLALTSKGYCILFGFMQKQLRYNAENLPPETNIAQYQYLIEEIYQSYKKNLLEKVAIEQKAPSLPLAAAAGEAITKERIPATRPANSISSTNNNNINNNNNQLIGYEYADYQTNNILLNGKIIDAILRANGYSFEHVIQFWKKDLSKMIYQIYQPSSSSPSSSTSFASVTVSPPTRRKDDTKQEFLECVLSGYAALMSIAGYHNKPEYALSIARAFNKLSALLVEMQYRVWSQELWNHYYTGKKAFIKDYQRRYANLYSPMVNHLFSMGIENTIQLELRLYSQMTNIPAMPKVPATPPPPQKIANRHAASKAVEITSLKLNTTASEGFSSSSVSYGALKGTSSQSYGWNNRGKDTSSNLALPLVKVQWK